MKSTTMDATARLVTERVKAMAGALPNGVHAVAGRTQDRDLANFLKVVPTGSQILQSVVPGNVIEYKVITNKDWRLE
jgi:hypothetical protein